MILSDQTLELLFDVAGDRLATILRAIERDASDAGIVQDQCPQLAALANAAEAGEDPRAMLRLLRIIEANAPVPVQGYKRRLPANWQTIRTRIFGRDGALCRYCSTVTGPFHIDHIEPLRRGGSNDDSNLCVACEACNLSKKDSTVSEWAARLQARAGGVNVR